MTATTRRFSPRASLAALGLKLRRLGLLEAISAAVKIPEKTVRHTPAEKLYRPRVTHLCPFCGGGHPRIRRGTRPRDAGLDRRLLLPLLTAHHPHDIYDSLLAAGRSPGGERRGLPSGR